MTNQFIEYMKIHKISLLQDLDDAKNGVDIPDDEYFGADEYYEGAINTIDHLLSVANDMMMS